MDRYKSDRTWALPVKERGAAGALVCRVIVTTVDVRAHADSAAKQTIHENSFRQSFARRTREPNSLHKTKRNYTISQAFSGLETHVSNDPQTSNELQCLLMRRLSWPHETWCALSCALPCRLSLLLSPPAHLLCCPFPNWFWRRSYSHNNKRLRQPTTLYIR